MPYLPGEGIATPIDPYELYMLSVEQRITDSIAHVQAARALPRIEGTSTATTTIHDLLASAVANGTDGVFRPEHLATPPVNLRARVKPDIALPMFPYKGERGGPIELARSVAGTLSANKHVFGSVTASGPYVNIRVNDRLLLTCLSEIVSFGKDYGRSRLNEGQVAIVDYSSPNVAKPFGVNHLRSTVIGESLARLLDASGYTVLRDNHLGDWGTQFGNLLAAHSLYEHERPFQDMTVDDLNRLYVRFNTDKRESPVLARLGRQYLVRLERGDPELLDQWNHARRLSEQEFNRVYQRLGITFDTTIGEGYYVKSAQQLVERLVADGVEQIHRDEDTDAVYIDGIEQPVVLRTADGYCVYAARDLATIIFRTHRYRPDLITYVVGEEQASSFREVFSLAERIGLNDIHGEGRQARLEYIGFGLLLDGSGKKLSTRKGTSGKLEDVIDEIDARAYEETANRNPSLDEQILRDISSKIAVGAIIWNDLRNSRESSSRFDINRMLTLGGGSVVDILYGYLRSKSVLERVGEDTVHNAPMSEAFTTDIEHSLAYTLSEFPAVVQRAAEERSPHYITIYLQNLTALHGKFYETSRVAGIDNHHVAAMRALLHRAYMTVVENGLGLLNIPITPRI